MSECPFVGMETPAKCPEMGMIMHRQRTFALERTGQLNKNKEPP